ncbi:MAG: DUF1772 domain-containing protein [Deltaproteobacteria bacterium]|nr:DUF1772 domain-containing protein [Deltaproteobacteria bacterium]
MTTHLTHVLAIGCGLMGGLYFAFSAFIMQSLAEVPGVGGIEAMQSINRVIVKSPFIVLFFGTTLASVALAVWGGVRWGEPGTLALMVGGVVYLVGHFVCTAAFNVPLNDALDALDPTTPEAARVWADYLKRWTRWNHVRTVACLASCALFISAAWSGRG